MGPTGHPKRIERGLAPLRVGDHVRLNALGASRAGKIPIKTGVVVRIVKSASGGKTVYVLLDGNTTPTRLHRSYLELEP